ncbi:MAG TPA: efflux RND transporter periplasmic adaptor subunit [Gemmataceae bacterium]|nr:efflux RND transporter periplasmic adaptor subunit [Gemmataceae bacterium]
MPGNNRIPFDSDLVHSDPRPDDEGGLRAPPGLTGWRKAWWWFDFVILVKLARLRFIGILALIGVIITQWDTIIAYYDRWTRPASAMASAAASDTEYFCPMHPAVVRDNPRDKCPICFMPLSKRKKGESHVEALPAGVVNRVQLSPYRVVLAGVATWPVEYRPLAKEITAVGYVEFNERGQRTVSARVPGRIDKLVANETGKMVKQGDDLALLYSPELLVTEQNLLAAHQSGNKDLLTSARTRLELLGIDDEQIDAILAAGKPSTYLRIRSPIGGHVITKYVREGQYVQEGSPLYDVADLATVWIQAQVYEDDLAFLPVGYEHGSAASTGSGLEVTATTRAFPNEPFRGKLAFIYPHVDQDTRTVTVRFEVDNPGHRLRPGSTASVTLKVMPKDIPALSSAALDEHAAEMLAGGQVLAVPESSVIDTGSQRIVYRESVPNEFEGVEVKLGPRMSDPEGAPFYPVLAGLSAGERVVTSGSFLVDAETRLNPAAGSIYFGGSGGSSGGQSSVTTVRASTPEDPDAKIRAALAKLSPADRALADAQRFCPILTDNRLGSMGEPVKIVIDGQTVFLCCAGCKGGAMSDRQGTLAKVVELRDAAPAKAHDPDAKDTDKPTEVTPPADGAGEMTDVANAEQEIVGALAKLSADDRTLAESQRFCPVLKDSRLGSMGTPIKVMVDGQPVLVCCEGCTKRALAKPAKTLATVKELRSKSQQ